MGAVAGGRERDFHAASLSKNPRRDTSIACSGRGKGDKRNQSGRRSGPMTSFEAPAFVWEALLSAEERGRYFFDYLCRQCGEETTAVGWGEKKGWVRFLRRGGVKGTCRPFQGGKAAAFP